jgi:hypothetical protein
LISGSKSDSSNFEENGFKFGISLDSSRFGKTIVKRKHIFKKLCVKHDMEMCSRCIRQIKKISCNYCVDVVTMFRRKERITRVPQCKDCYIEGMTGFYGLDCIKVKSTTYGILSNKGVVCTVSETWLE